MSEPAGPESVPPLRLPREVLRRDTPPPPPERADHRRAVVIGTFAIGTVLLMALLTTATVGAAWIARAERAGVMAAQDLYARIEVESTLLRHDFVSERRAEIEREFAEAKSAPDPAARRESAGALVELLAQEARARLARPIDSEEALRRDLESAVRALRRLESELDVRERDLAATRASIPGRAAALFGI